MADLIGYSRRLEKAGIALVQGVLEEVVESGLPGDHHFYLTFDPRDSGVQLADALRASWPDEMTIVIQHQYDDLEVDGEGFSVRLSFSGVAHHIVVPWSALRRFVDPAAQFGLQFSASDEESADAPSRGPRRVDGPKASRPEEPAAASSEGAGETGSDSAGDQGEAGDVVSFDAFRKR